MPQQQVDIDNRPDDETNVKSDKETSAASQLIAVSSLFTATLLALALVRL